MKILQFHAENVKKLKVVDITPDGNSVILSGANEQGKTSALDAIQMALEVKTANRLNPQPIRRGQKKAVSSLTLGDNGSPTLKVSRTWTANDKSYLKVENGDGLVFKSPQAILDALIGDLTFDPLAFSRLPEKEQLDTLLKLIKISLDLDKWAAERKAVYDERTLTNRRVAELEAQLKGMVIDANAPSEEVSPASILEEQEKAQAIINKNRERRHCAFTARDGLEFRQKQHENLLLEVSEIKQKLLDAETRLSGTAQVIADLTKQCAELDEECQALVDPDLSVFRQRIAEVEETNRRVRENRGYFRLEEALQAQKAESMTATEQLQTLDETRAAAIREAQMPIPDLSFDDDGITYRGVPFVQCSSEERLRVSVAMGMALNPKLRIMFIRDGSLLDTRNRELIQQMASDQDYQLWMEVTDDTGKVGLYFEDGEIVGRG